MHGGSVKPFQRQQQVSLSRRSHTRWHSLTYITPTTRHISTSTVEVTDSTYGSSKFRHEGYVLRLLTQLQEMGCCCYILRMIYLSMATSSEIHHKGPAKFTRNNVVSRGDVAGFQTAKTTRPTLTDVNVY